MFTLVLFSLIQCSVSVHEKFKMYGAPPPADIVFYPFGPRSALDINQHARGGVLQLHHDNGLEVPKLIPVGEKVCWESSPWRVRHGANVLPVGVTLTVTVEPHHVQLRTPLL